jgi:hypothetical protein
LCRSLWRTRHFARVRYEVGKYSGAIIFFLAAKIETSTKKLANWETRLILPYFHPRIEGIVV